MINSQQISLMRELVEVQEARKANWPTPDGPADKDAEAVHREKISAIRNKLSDRRVSGPENTPAVDASDLSEGLQAPRRATFFSRVMRWVRTKQVLAPMPAPQDHEYKIKLSRR
jgi:hypothetical protein